MLYKKLIIALACCLTMFVLTGVTSDQKAGEFTDNINNSELSSNRDVFIGVLRITMAEVVSRFQGNDGPLKNGFLDFALTTDLTLNDGDSILINTTWDAAAGWTDVAPYNLMAVASLVNSEYIGTGYSEPPDGHPYMIYPIDAAASATISNNQFNVVSADFSHTVYVEEGTRSGSG